MAVSTIKKGSYWDYWDPASEIAFGSSRLIWASACVYLCLSLGPSFLQSVSTVMVAPQRDMAFIPDLFQDYASAKNYTKGIDVYTDHTVSAKEYMNIQLSDDNLYNFKLNAHPPGSILFFLPLAYLDFPAAFRTWNVISLTLLIATLLMAFHQLEVPLSIWSLPPAVALVLLSSGVWYNLWSGQLSLVLLFLFTGIWAANRTGHTIVAGCLLGLATALKIFPGFLFLYFALVRRWRIVGAGAATLAVITVITIIMFGIETYIAYIHDVYPKFSWFRNSWTNVAIAGVWSRLFDTAPWVQRGYSLAKPIIYAPGLAHVLTLACDMIVIVFLARAIWHTRKTGDLDSSYGASVLVMILVTPIAWDHYMVILALPFLITWRNLDRSSPQRWFFLASVYMVLGISSDRLNSLCLQPNQIASPVHSIALFNLKTYILLFLFIKQISGIMKMHAVPSLTGTRNGLDHHRAAGEDPGR